jgi:hypothetical protein
MRRDLECRLRAVEVAGSGRIPGSLRRKMTFEEAEALWSAVRTIPVLLSETDLNL